MANLLYISLPPRSVALKDPEWAQTCQLHFALMSDSGQLIQQGTQTVDEIRVLAPANREIRFLLAASDAPVFEISVPPMSAARFKAALPNLMEEHLSQDFTDLALAAGPVRDGKVQVAVADRSWLQTLVGLFAHSGVRKFMAFPAHLAARSEDAPLVWLSQFENVTELAVNAGAGRTSAVLLDQPDAGQIIKLLDFMLQNEGEGPVQFVVVGGDAGQWSEQIAAVPEYAGWQVQTSGWSCRVRGVSAALPDLMKDLDFAVQPAIDWKRWRWPLALVAAAIVVNVVALNIEWLSLKREEKALKTAVVDTFRSSFPNEPVQFPLEQMQRKLAAAQQQAGQFSSTDFASVAFRFAQSWDRVMAGKNAAIESMEFKDHVLLIKVKPDVQVPVDMLSAALNEQALRLDKKTDSLWQVSAGGKNK